ncbi:MAG: hypothetical protein PF489_10140, partial [Salinivirgaceae bacterium]|nr:hypothetical protein [Salinivirgaceae bacterium]
MKVNKPILILFTTWLSISCFAQDSIGVAKSDVFIYTNPVTRDTSIAMRDHCIIKVGEKWYCTGTS